MRAYFAAPSTAEISQQALNASAVVDSAPNGKVHESELLGRFETRAVELAVSRQSIYPLVQNGERFYVSNAR